MGDNCPKCDSNMFDGTHCLKCGYEIVEPFLKGSNQSQCVICGVEVIFPVFYGYYKKNMGAKEMICQECYVARRNSNHREYMEEYNPIKRSPKRVEQERNLERWCRGEIVD